MYNRLQRAYRVSLIISSAALIVPGAAAHDFWIEPATFRPAPGATLKIALRVGEHLKGDAVKRNKEKIERFALLGADGEKPVIGQDGADPAGLARCDAPGVYTIVYRTKPSRVELDAAKFEAYLKEEGLERIIAERKKSGASEKPGRELYSRCAKSLILAGDAQADGWERRAGLPLEIVPESNPHVLAPGALLPLRVLYLDKPAEGLLVVALNRNAKSPPQTVRTDAEGRVKLKLDAGGMWLIKCVHMVPAPRDKTAAPPDKAADWESLWASLTFELPAAGQ